MAAHDTRMIVARKLCEFMADEWAIGHELHTQRAAEILAAINYEELRLSAATFLGALDSGWFGSDPTKLDLSDTAAIDNLRRAVAHVEQRS